ncbi:MAG: DUF4124 domain-containing protein [Pseudomonadales bacterium]
MYRQVNHQGKNRLYGFAALTITLAAITALAAPPVFAEIYRVIDENGKVSFTDKPPPGTASADAEQVSVDENVQNTSMSPAAVEQKQPEWLKEAIEKRKAEEAARKAAAPNAAEMTAWRESLANAKRALNDAKRAKERGVIASEGDFIGKAGGGVRPSDQYFEKLRKLEQDVIEAEKQLKSIRQAKPG